MNTYYWCSESLLGAYTCGYIIVNAESVDEARKKARSYVKHHSHFYGDYRNSLETDIADEPEIIADVFLVWGGD